MRFNCAITGASGFVGENLTSYLKERKFSFKAISRNQLSGLKSEDFGLCETIIHLAGKAHDLKAADSEGYNQVNFELTKKAYDQFLLSDAKKFIFLSSVKASADQVDGILTEAVEPAPKTPYGKSKLMAEQYIQSKPLPNGKSYYILRPCMIYGLGNKGNLNLLYKAVKTGMPYPLAGFNNQRSFVSVQNLCFIIQELLCRSDIPTGVYHVADDECLSTTEVITILANSLNKKPILWNISPKLISFLAKVGDTFHLFFTTERLQKLTESYVVSNSKIKNAINKPLPIKVKDGLGLAAASFQ